MLQDIEERLDKVADTKLFRTWRGHGKVESCGRLFFFFLIEVGLV